MTIADFLPYVVITGVWWIDIPLGLLSNFVFGVLPDRTGIEQTLNVFAAYGFAALAVHINLQDRRRTRFSPNPGRPTLQWKMALAAGICCFAGLVVAVLLGLGSKWLVITTAIVILSGAIAITGGFLTFYARRSYKSEHTLLRLVEYKVFGLLTLAALYTPFVAVLLRAPLAYMAKMLLDRATLLILFGILLWTPVLAVRVAIFAFRRPLSGNRQVAATAIALDSRATSCGHRD